jgi:DNA-binding NarL/FixJ family response regulator
MTDDTPNLDGFNLTDREIVLISAMFSADSEQAIAKRLSISRPTLKRSMKEVFGKLGVQNRLELILFVTYHEIPKSGTSNSGE